MSFTNDNMPNGTNVKAVHSAFVNAGNHPDDAEVAPSLDDDFHDDFDNDYDNDDGEDNTARLDLRRQSLNSSNDNVEALQRVKSLAQRNRMVISRLSGLAKNLMTSYAAHSGT